MIWIWSFISFTLFVVFSLLWYHGLMPFSFTCYGCASFVLWAAGDRLVYLIPSLPVLLSDYGWRAYLRICQLGSLVWLCVIRIS